MSKQTGYSIFMTKQDLTATRKHLCRLMNRARLAGDVDSYVALQDQLAATY